MKNVLIVSQDKQLLKMLGFPLESQFKLTLLECPTVEKAIGILDEKGSEIRLIVCDYRIGGEKLMMYYLSKHPNAYVICFGFEHLGLNPTPEDDATQVRLIRQPELLTTLIETCSRIFPALAVDTDYRDQEYCRIKTELLIDASPLMADVYIQLSPTKILKLFQTGDSFTFDDLERYAVRKQIEFLYLKIGDTKIFMSKLQTSLNSLMQKVQSNPQAPIQFRETDVSASSVQATADSLRQVAPGISVEELLKNVANVHDTLADLIKKLGFTPEVQDVTKTSVQLTIEAMRKSDKLSVILRSLKKDERTYLSFHSMLMSYISCLIATQMEWKSQATYQKLTLASLLHDITLQKDELAAVKDMKDLETKSHKFTREDQNDYRNHPNTAAELARKIQEVPPDVDVIISQHHERPDGKGFPRAVSGMRIMPLPSVFIVAHDLVNFLVERCPDLQISPAVVKEFVQLRGDEYSTGNFKKILKTVQGMRF